MGKGESAVLIAPKLGGKVGKVMMADGIDYNGNYMTIVSKTHPEYHREHIIIHDGMYNLACFNTREQLERFMDYLGFTAELVQTEKAFYDGTATYETYKLSHKFVEPKCHEFKGESYELFWSLSEVPDDALPITLLSNGSLCTGYFLNDGKTISIYRPNPNAKEVYKPLSLKAHIEYAMKYGSF